MLLKASNFDKFIFNESLHCDNRIYYSIVLLFMTVSQNNLITIIHIH